MFGVIMINDHDFKTNCTNQHISFYLLYECVCEFVSLLIKMFISVKPGCTSIHKVYILREQIVNLLNTTLKLNT